MAKVYIFLFRKCFVLEYKNLAYNKTKRLNLGDFFDYSLVNGMRGKA